MKFNAPISNEWEGLSWSPWIPLNSSLEVFLKNIIKEPGFYRIRSLEIAGLVYIGQTGRDLRERTRSLARGTYADLNNPPWNDPHTAAPLLWAYIQQDKLTYEVSIASANFDYQDRQCYEDYLLYLHRLHYGYSTLINHGKLNPYWTRPTNRTKGIPTKYRDDPLSYESIQPAIGRGNPTDKKWLDLDWSEFRSINNSFSELRGCAGVYRIKCADEIIYFGESKNLKTRIKAHSKNKHFKDVLISVHKMPQALPHQLKERETDLIGAYYLKKKCSPKYQYKPN